MRYLRRRRGTRAAAYMRVGARGGGWGGRRCDQPCARFSSFSRSSSFARVVVAEEEPPPARHDSKSRAIACTQMVRAASAKRRLDACAARGLRTRLRHGIQDIGDPHLAHRWLSLTRMRLLRSMVCKGGCRESEVEVRVSRIRGRRAEGRGACV